MEKYVKKLACLVLALFVCIALPSCCGKKCSKKKTTETVEQEVDVKNVDIRKIKEMAEL